MPRPHQHCASFPVCWRITRTARWSAQSTGPFTTKYPAPCAASASPDCGGAHGCNGRRDPALYVDWALAVTFTLPLTMAGQL